MDYDDFERKMRAQRIKNFELFQQQFNAAMRQQGRDVTLGDVLGEGKFHLAPLDGSVEKLLPKDALPVMPPWCEEKMATFTEYFVDIFTLTTDEDPRDLVLRAMGVYRAFVKHARAGGQVKFVKDGEKDRTLKVRLR